MKNILVIGAGRTSSSLINYLFDKSAEFGWLITIADTIAGTCRTKSSKSSECKSYSI